VDVIEPDGGMAHEHFARPGLADLDFFPAHFLGTAGLMNAYCVRHVLFSFFSQSRDLTGFRARPKHPARVRRFSGGRGGVFYRFKLFGEFAALSSDAPTATRARRNVGAAEVARDSRFSFRADASRQAAGTLIQLAAMIIPGRTVGISRTCVNACRAIRVYPRRTDVHA